LTVEVAGHGVVSHTGSALIIHRVRKPDWSIVVGDLRLLC